jgi:hypothetical protein
MSHNLFGLICSEARLPFAGESNHARKNQKPAFHSGTAGDLRAN